MHRTIFVVGQPSTVEERNLLQEELRLHSDILVLSCNENMNEGKTYVYFKEALEKFPCFDYYAKVDDDTAFVPTQITDFLPSNPGNQLLYAGRSPVDCGTDFISYLRKTAKWGFRDMSWVFSVKRYHAGMIYLISRHAVELWVGLGPVDVYGDEDYRTAYYMGIIGARILDMNTSFHDYMMYQNIPMTDHWKKPITNQSLAVHQCKSYTYLSNALDELCGLHQ
jgi:hypothetical protein